ncbi:MAG: AraC family ligand binding domain-containing protein [Actinobacteria bacterium]|nr:AraC family ligand binding domain-containing protein [Actinomycetota bacterium]
MKEPTRWQSAHLSDLESLAGPGTLSWQPVRRAFGITGFGVNAYTAAEVGQDVVEEHTEESLGHEELYIVLAGRATFQLDGEELDAPTGTLVFLADPSVRRGAKAAEPGTTVLAIGGEPGRHDVSAWEWYFAAYAYSGDGEHEQAIAELQAGLEQRPGHPRLLYHLACVEARAGRREPALEHLNLAVMSDPRLREHAAKDDDFESIRDDPRFLD